MEEQLVESVGTPVVMYVINSFDGGGAEAGLVTMVRGGVFAGSHLNIVGLVRGNGSIETKLTEEGHKPTILVDEARMRSSHLPVIFLRLRQLIARIRPHIVIASLPQANLLARLSTIFRKDIVFVSFEHNSHLAKRAYEIGYRLTSRRVDWVFADAESTLKVVLQRLYRRIPEKQTIVPLVAFASHDNSVKWTVLGGSFHMVNAARFTPVKNQSALIEAIATLDRDVKLTLYGDGPTRDKCEALAARLGVSARVHFPGFVSDWAKRPADLFVLPSRHEGLCIVVLEAMHARIPVAAPVIGGLRDYVEPGLIRELRSVDPHEIARTIAAAMDDRSGNESMAQRAGHMVDLRFGADAVRAIHGSINRALIEGVNRPAHSVELR